MADTPEIPESKDPYEKQVAITIAMLAVILSLVSNFGDNAKTEAIIKTNEATNKWGYFQSKSIKEHLTSSESEILTLLSANGDKVAIDKALERLHADKERYGKEKGEIKGEAEQLIKDASTDQRINDRCDLSSLFLQFAIILCSVAILSRWKILWGLGLATGLGGAVVGVTAWLL